MKRLLDRIWGTVRRIRGLKYAVVALIAVVLIGFVDENSVWSHFRNKQRIDELETEIRRYSQLNSYNQEQLRLLERDPKAIERIARERYFMKNDDEDIFVLSDDQQSFPTDETAE